MSWNGSQSDGFKSKLVKLVLWENEVSRVEFNGN